MIQILSNKDFIYNSNSIKINTDRVRGPGCLLIYADWCGHCRTFKPVYNDLDAAIGDKFTLCAIEESAFKDVEFANALAINSFPTLRFFDNDGKFETSFMGSVLNYKGGRDINSLLKYICKYYKRCSSF
jgi:thiol-disulfide isomerase/thioredoxin